MSIFNHLLESSKVGEVGDELQPLQSDLPAVLGRQLLPVISQPPESTELSALFLSVCRLGAAALVPDVVLI